MMQSLWRTVWRLLKRLRIKQSYDPTIPLLGIYPMETIIEKDTCTPVFEVSQVALVVNNPPANATDIRDMGSILG